MRPVWTGNRWRNSSKTYPTICTRCGNRLASGSYYPPPVLQVEIPKAQGGMRTLGIPTVADRIAQLVVKQAFEPCVEPYFHSDSYGYRPGKSALQAVGVTRQRCWRYDYVLEFDIKVYSMRLTTGY